MRHEANRTRLVGLLAFTGNNKRLSAVAGALEILFRKSQFQLGGQSMCEYQTTTFCRTTLFSHSTTTANVDLVFYGNPRQLEYDFVMAPGADPRKIMLRFSGTRKLRLDQQGNLLVSLADCGYKPLKRWLPIADRFSKPRPQGAVALSVRHYSFWSPKHTQTAP